MTRRPGRAALTAALVMLTAGLSLSPAAGADRALHDALRGLQLVPLAGQVPPPFSLERLGDGKRVTLAEHRGRPVLLYFWATW